MRRFRKLPRRSIAKADPVTPALRDAVLARDGACVAWLIDRSHVCRDAWGRPHSPRALAMLTLEHVKDQLMAGRRAPSDPAHLVALCYGANVGVPSKELRALLRAYLRDVDDVHASHVDPCPACPPRWTTVA